MSRVRPRLTYANCVSTLCLFIVLGGGAYAATALPKHSVGARQLRNGAVATKALKNRAVTTKKIKNGAVTISKLNTSGLTAPNAVHASSADTAGTAAPSGVAGGALTGTYPSPGLASAESWHEIGSAGQPAFQNGWTNYDPLYETAAFYKDPYGVVHLKGVVKNGSSPSAFTLPAGYRPALTALFGDVHGMIYVGVDATGDVRFVGTTDIRPLDGITFRAGG